VKRKHFLVFNLILVLILLAGSVQGIGCKTDVVNNNNYQTSTPNSSTSGPFIFQLSFQDPAPRPGQITVIKSIVKVSNGNYADNVSITFDVPQGIEIVEGPTSSYFGSLSPGESRELSIKIRPIKNGNFIISSYLDLSLVDAGFNISKPVRTIYLMVNDSSSVWGIVPPWDTIRTPIQPTRIPEKAP
jgi:hypothetical protein